MTGYASPVVRASGGSRKRARSRSGLESGHGAAGFLVGILAAQGIALILVLFPLAQTDFNLGPAFQEIHFERDHGVPLGGNQPLKPFNFTTMKQQGAGPGGFVIKAVPALVGGNVNIIEENPPGILDFGVPACQGDIRGSDRFDFGSQGSIPASKRSTTK